MPVTNFPAEDDTRFPIVLTVLQPELEANVARTINTTQNASTMGF